MTNYTEALLTDIEARRAKLNHNLSVSGRMDDMYVSMKRHAKNMESSSDHQIEMMIDILVSRLLHNDDEVSMEQKDLLKCSKQYI